MYVKHNISFREGSSQGRFDLTLGPKQTMGKAVESVLVSSQLPRSVLNASLTASQGTHTFDPVTKVPLFWNRFQRFQSSLSWLYLDLGFLHHNVLIHLHFHCLAVGLRG